MDFYLYTLDSNNKIVNTVHLPMNPELITVIMGSVTKDFNIMRSGEVRIPQGNKLDQISWEGKLPGAGLKGQPFVKEWKDPKSILKVLTDAKEKGTKLRLVVTETPINIDVCIEEITPSFSGGMGNIDYKIQLYEAKDLIVMNMTEYAKANTKGKGKTQNAKRPSPKKAKTYVVKKGDSLWKIAHKQMGDGDKYKQLQAANKPPIRDSKKDLKPGMVLTIPV